jgi:hypothetical protein
VATSNRYAVVSLGNRLAVVALVGNVPRRVGVLPPLPQATRLRSLGTDQGTTVALLVDGRILVHVPNASVWQTSNQAPTHDICVVGPRLLRLSDGQIAIGPIEDPARREAMLEVDRRVNRLTAVAGGVVALGPGIVHRFDIDGRDWRASFRTERCGFPTGVAASAGWLVVTDDDQGLLAWRTAGAVDGDTVAASQPTPRHPRGVVALGDEFIVLGDEGLVQWSVSGSAALETRQAGVQSIHSLGDGLLAVGTASLAYWSSSASPHLEMLPGRSHDVAICTTSNHIYIAAEMGLFKALPAEDAVPMAPPLPSAPHAVASAGGLIALASTAGVALLDEAGEVATWLAESAAEPVALAMADDGEELACALGSTVLQLVVKRSPLALAVCARHELDVYAWALTYQGKTLWLACGDGGLVRLPRAGSPAVVGLVPFAVAVAAAGSWVACATSAEVVLINTDEDPPRIIARRHLSGDVAACAFQGDQLLVATAVRLAVLDIASHTLHELGSVPLPFSPTVVRPFPGGVIVAGAGGSSIVTDNLLGGSRNRC